MKVFRMIFGFLVLSSFGCLLFSLTDQEVVNYFKSGTVKEKIIIIELAISLILNTLLGFGLFSGFLKFRGED